MDELATILNNQLLKILDRENEVIITDTNLIEKIIYALGVKESISQAGIYLRIIKEL